MTLKTKCQGSIEIEKTHNPRNIVKLTFCVAIIQPFPMINDNPSKNRK